MDKILSDLGKYFLTIPDKRYCFDHFVLISRVGSFFEAHTLKSKTHSLHNAVAAATLSGHNNRLLDWLGAREEQPNVDKDPTAYEAAVEQYNFANGAYIICTCLTIFSYQFL